MRTLGAPHRNVAPRASSLARTTSLGRRGELRLVQLTVAEHGERTLRTARTKPKDDHGQTCRNPFVAAAIFIVINILVSRLAVWIERRGSKKAAGGTAPATIGAGAREGISVAK